MAISPPKLFDTEFICRLVRGGILSGETVNYESIAASYGQLDFTEISEKMYWANTIGFYD